MPMIVNCVAYKDGARLGDIDVERISDVLEEQGTFVWVGLHEPDLPLLRKVQAEFGLHELAVEDALSAHQRPKLEEYGESLFVVLQTAQWWDESMHLGETHLFVGKRFLVSVRHGPSMTYSGVRERCEANPVRLAMGPGYALYAVMDFVVDNYAPIVERFSTRLEALESAIFGQQFDRAAIEQLYALKRELQLLRGAAAPVLDICTELMRLHSDIVPKDTREYFRDIRDHVRRVVEATDAMREMLTAAMQVHLALASVAQNEVVKRLAGWGAILAIPTMVFSLYGMNFRHMPELEWPFGYPLVLGGIVVGCAWLYRRLRRVGWL
jgi:magnesium transporter